MSTEKVAEKKVIRRGISTARGTSRLKFSNEIAKPNGLFIAHLDSVEVKTITIGEDKTGMPTFNGLEIPKLVLTFASNEEDAQKRRYVTLQFMPVESNAETIPSGKDAWKVDIIFNWFKHLMTTFVAKNRELTEEEEVALSLNYQDFDDNGEYVPVEPEEVIASWKSLFENFENIFNRGGKDEKPVYKTTDNKFIPIWIKLVRCLKTKKGWSNVANGDLSFPSIVGEGCIEIFKQNTPPSIRLDVIRESIVPKVEDKPKTPNLGMMPVNNMAGVSVSPMSGGFDNVAMESAADDMPF